MNLYELSANYQGLLNHMQDMDTNNPDDAEVFKSTLESLDDAIEVKADGIAHVLQQLRYDEETLAKEIKRLQSKKKALSNNQKNLKSYLKDSMEFIGKDKIKSPQFTIWTQNNPPKMVVKDETFIPKEFYEEQQPQLNKRELRDYLKENDVEGVTMEVGRGLRIR